MYVFEFSTLNEHLKIVENIKRLNSPHSDLYVNLYNYNQMYTNMTQNHHVFEISSKSIGFQNTQKDYDFEKTFVIQTNNTQFNDDDSCTISTGLKENEDISQAEKDIDQINQNLMNADY